MAQAHVLPEARHGGMGSLHGSPQHPCGDPQGLPEQLDAALGLTGPAQRFPEPAAHPDVIGVVEGEVGHGLPAEAHGLVEVGRAPGPLAAVAQRDREVIDQARDLRLRLPAREHGQRLPPEVDADVEVGDRLGPPIPPQVEHDEVAEHGSEVGIVRRRAVEQLVPEVDRLLQIDDDVELVIAGDQQQLAQMEAPRPFLIIRVGERDCPVDHGHGRPDVLDDADGLVPPVERDGQLAQRHGQCRILLAQLVHDLAEDRDRLIERSDVVLGGRPIYEIRRKRLSLGNVIEGGAGLVGDHLGVDIVHRAEVRQRGSALRVGRCGGVPVDREPGPVQMPDRKSVV